MALTEIIRLALEGKGFNRLFEEYQAEWTALAESAREFIRPQIENGQPTVDDIKQVLQPIIELERRFRDFMADHPKLTQNYWASRFTDYVLHRVYQPRLTVIPEERRNE